jgi:hypothetical protein
MQFGHGHSIRTCSMNIDIDVDTDMGMEVGVEVGTDMTWTLTTLDHRIRSISYDNFLTAKSNELAPR